MPKLCQFENCKKRANYGNDNKKNIFCREHKTDNMKIMSLTLCLFKDCKKRAHYGNELKKNMFCIQHKTDDTVVTWCKICEVDDCKLQSTFNFEGEKHPRFCATHKLEGMVNVKQKKCELDGCKTYPTFNFEGFKKGRFCLEHKLEGMLCVKKQTCIFENCNLSPSFNFEGEYARYCLKHKMEGMIDVVHKKCHFFNCYKAPSFNFKGEKATYCFTHKKDGMIDVKNAKCKNDGCPSIANKKYKNYCSYCFQHLFPLDPLTFQIRCKTKELAVRDFINANYEGFNHDKILEYGGCDCLTRRRIDHRKLIGNTLLCIETDENQHKSYSKQDEETRYNDLLVNFTCKYIIIRFNPDSYINKKGTKTNPYISERLKILKTEIDKQMLEVIHLYYDGYK